jgi:hypothetical protein
MSSIKRIMPGVLFSATVVASSTFFATSANAVYVCGAHQVCLYEQDGFRGGVAIQPAFNNGRSGSSDSNFHDNHYSNQMVMDNSISSVVNNSALNLFLSRDPNLQGDRNYSCAQIRKFDGLHGRLRFRRGSSPVFQRSGLGWRDLSVTLDVRTPTGLEPRVVRRLYMSRLSRPT